MAESLIFSSTGLVGDPEVSPLEADKILLSEILDKFCGEISRRILEHDATLELLGASDPRCDSFLDEQRVSQLCELYPRLHIDQRAIEGNWALHGIACEQQKSNRQVIVSHISSLLKKGSRISSNFTSSFCRSPSQVPPVNAVLAP